MMRALKLKIASAFIGFATPAPAGADFCSEHGYSGGSHTVCHFSGGVQSVEDIPANSADILDVIRPSPAIIVRRRNYMHIIANPCEVWCYR